MEEADKCWMMIRMVGGWVFLLVPAHQGSPGQRAVKRLLLLCLCVPGGFSWLAAACNLLDKINVLSLTKFSKLPNHLRNLISVQHCSTRSSSVVTLTRPPTSSALRLTDHSFQYALPCLWNRLPVSRRQPHFSPSVFNSLLLRLSYRLHLLIHQPHFP